MNMNRHRIGKSIGALVLAMVLAVSLGGFVPKQTFAAGGTAKVTLTHVDELSADTEFEFELYKVGHFDGPNLALDDEFKGSNAKVSIPNKEDYNSEAYGGKTWENAWLDSANTLGKYINSMTDKPAPVGGTHSLKPGESFEQFVPENGLYLVMSKTVRDAENANVNWTPQPMYISILDGDQEATLTNNEVVVKIVRTPVVFNHKVTKKWNIPEGESENLRPAEINLMIFYGGDVIHTIKLNEENNWSFDWESEEADETYKFIYQEDGEEKVIEFEPDLEDPVWSCVEIFDAAAFREATGRDATEEEQAELMKLAKRFTWEAEDPDPQRTEQTGVEQFYINNTYARKELELTKKLDGYVDAGDRSNVTTAFRVIAKDQFGNEVYNKVVGITFAKDDEVDENGMYSKTKVISDLPANAEEITVTEVYSSQYTGDETQTNQGENPGITYDSERDIWTVTMENTHDFHQGSGVVNKYTDGEIEDQEGLIENSGN